MGLLDPCATCSQNFRIIVIPSQNIISILGALERCPVSHNNRWTVQWLLGGNVDNPKMVLECLGQHKANWINYHILWPGGIVCALFASPTGIDFSQYRGWRGGECRGCGWYWPCVISMQTVFKKSGICLCTARGLANDTVLMLPLDLFIFYLNFISTRWGSYCHKMTYDTPSSNSEYTYQIWRVTEIPVMGWSVELAIAWL